jgi:hypothetical protein
MAKTETVNHLFTMTNEQLKNFLDKIKDLVSIDEEVLLKVDNDNILMYSLVGEKKNVNAFKSFIIKTDELFTFKEELTTQMKFIIPNGKKFDSNVRNFLDYQEKLDCKFVMNDAEYADTFFIKNKFLKLNNIGGDPRGATLNIDIEQIKDAIDKNKADFKFVLPKDVFDKIKKMSKIEVDNDILYLNIKNKTLTIAENAWELTVCEIEEDGLSITFPKKYFNSLQIPDGKTEVEVFVFDSFLLVDNENTSLLVALELTL